jgi:hypothetical protein
MFRVSIQNLPTTIMRRISTSLALLAIGLLIADCSDEQPVSQNVNIYTGENGFVVNGGLFKNQVVNCPVGVMDFSDALGNQRTIRVGGAVINKREFEVDLVLPLDATKPGEYKWVDATGATFSDAYMVFSRDELTFNSISGKTVITAFGNVGGIVRGRFNGAVLDPGTGESIYLDGKFSVSRLD